MGKQRKILEGGKGGGGDYGKKAGEDSRKLNRCDRKKSPSSGPRAPRVKTETGCLFFLQETVRNLEKKGSNQLGTGSKNTQDRGRGKGYGPPTNPVAMFIGLYTRETRCYNDYLQSYTRGGRRGGEGKIVKTRGKSKGRRPKNSNKHKTAVTT